MARRSRILSIAMCVAASCLALVASPAAADPSGTVALASTTVPGTLSVHLVGTTPGSVWFTSSFDFDEAPQFLRLTGTTVTSTQFFQIPNCCGLEFTGGPYLWACDGGGFCTWTNVDTNATGTVPDTWQQPYPSGGLFVSNGKLIAQSYAQVAGNHTTPLGAVGAVFRILTGPNGAVVFADSKETSAGYYPYDGSGRVALATPAGASLSCDHVSSTGVGCYDSVHHTVVRLRLNGSAPVSTPEPDQPAEVLVTATNTGWFEPDGLHTVPAGGGTAATQTVSNVTTALADDVDFYFTRSGAFGTAGLYRAHDATTAATKVYTAPHMPRQAGSVALSAGRAAWTDNETAQEPVWIRNLTTSGTSIQLGARSTVGNSNDFPASPTDAVTQHSLSGSRLLWAASSDTFPFDQVATVSTPTSHVVLPEQAEAIQRLSGSRVLYQGPESDEKVYDLVHGTTLDVTATYGAVHNVDLFGNYVVYATADGSIWRKDLTSAAAARQVLGPVPAGNTFTFSSVATDGDWVAWTREYHSGSTFVTSSGYRNARTMGAVTSLPDADSFPALIASPDGVVYRDASSASHDFVLKPWTGSAIVLPKSNYLPSVYASYVGWSDLNGTPKAAPLPRSFANQPRSLGNPFAAVKFAAGQTWSFDLVTTAPLTSCTVKITTPYNVAVRTLGCQAGGMKVGEAVTSWNGRDADGHQVAAGTYRWSVVGGNADGALLNADGTTHATTGTVRVTA